MMKSIVSMLFVLATALLLASPAQARYADGMNTYAAYHVMQGAVDPMGTNKIEVTGLNRAGFERTGVLNPTLKWTFDIPEGECGEGEEPVYEMDVTWIAIGFAQEPLSASRGGYHVSFDGSNELAGPHTVHLGSGPGRDFGDRGYLEECARELIPGYEQMDEQQQLQAQRQNSRQLLECSKQKSSDARLERSWAGVAGMFTYSIKLHCVCVGEIDWKEMWNKTGGAGRGAGETATEDKSPSRFRMTGQKDLRNFNRWIMGGPTGEEKDFRTLSETSGGFVYEVPPNNIDFDNFSNYITPLGGGR